MRDIAGVHRNDYQKVTSFWSKMAPLLPHWVEAEALEGRDKPFWCDSTEFGHDSLLERQTPV